MTPPRTRRTALTGLGGFAIAAALVAAPLAPGAAFGIAPAAADVQAGSSLTANGDVFAAGDTLTLSYATDAPLELNWIGIYPADREPGDQPSIVWQYAPDASGTAEFALDLPAGDYAAWFLADDGYEPLADPVLFSIEADAAAPQPGDPNAPVEISPIETTLETDDVISRTPFDAEGADGWQVTVDDEATGEGSDAYRGWSFVDRASWTADVDQMRGRFGRTAGAFAVADAQQFGDALSTTLEGAPVDVSGLAQVRLSFDSHYRGAPGQSGSVSVRFDDGDEQELLRLDAESVDGDEDVREFNAAHDLTADVPEGAETATFSWTFEASDAARYWAIDSVAVHRVLLDADEAPTQAWVMSDIQGHPQDWQHAIGDYGELAPDADAMIIVGDHVNTGAAWEWDEMYDVMAATEGERPRQTISTIGNHERYALGGFEANRQRFLDFAERDRVWDEYVVEGPSGDVPVIALGQEFAGPSDVPMSDAQVEFLEERLAYWTEQDKQVMVLTHFPLGDTVSASWIPWYHDHHMMNDRLTTILGNYPNAVVFSGHTHYPAEDGDWAVQRRTEGGHPDGFWAVNTLAMHVGWQAVGEDSTSPQEITIGDVNMGLTVDAYDDRMVVRAYDFFDDEQLREVTIPNPLVESAVALAPEPEEPGEDAEENGEGTEESGSEDPGEDAGAEDADENAEAGAEDAGADESGEAGAEDAGESAADAEESGSEDASDDSTAEAGAEDAADAGDGSAEAGTEDAGAEASDSAESADPEDSAAGAEGSAGSADDAGDSDESDDRGDLQATGGDMTGAVVWGGIAALALGGGALLIAGRRTARG
ncbi:DUF4073 domain-containing protein [Microbacterium sp. gxy059]|uniref:DUF4073 domain-containing protein n=1 Tax=Microbacterium sp. gxy059 TaxID=2957199 RepID=UPI003D9515B6